MDETDSQRISRERMEDDLAVWYANRGSSDMTTGWAAFGQPLAPLPIAGHQCSVDGCVGYVRHGKRCADHIPRTVS